MEFRTIADIQARSALLQGAGNLDSFKEVKNGRQIISAARQAEMARQEAEVRASGQEELKVVDPRPIFELHSEMVWMQSFDRREEAAEAAQMLDRAWDRVLTKLALTMPDIASKEFDFVLKNGRLELVDDGNLSNSENSLLTDWLNGQEDLLAAAHAYHDAIRANYGDRHQRELAWREARHEASHGEFDNEAARTAFRAKTLGEMSMRDLGKAQELESGKIRFRDMLTELQYYRKYGDSWFERGDPNFASNSRHEDPAYRYTPALQLAQKYLNGFTVGLDGLKMHFRRA